MSNGTQIESLSKMAELLGMIDVGDHGMLPFAEGVVKLKGERVCID